MLGNYLVASRVVLSSIELVSYVLISVFKIVVMLASHCEGVAGDEMELKQIVLSFSLSHNLSILTHLSQLCEVCDSPDQTAHITRCLLTSDLARSYELRI
jgi:hypothetical protein